MRDNQPRVEFLCNMMNINFENDVFPAGSMYWFRPEALRGLEKIPSTIFDIEDGLVDATAAHAVERIICNIVEDNDFDKLEL